MTSILIIVDSIVSAVCIGMFCNRVAVRMRARTDSRGRRVSRAVARQHRAQRADLRKVIGGAR